MKLHVAVIGLGRFGYGVAETLVKEWCYVFFFFNDPATTEISTLPLPDALPIYARGGGEQCPLHQEPQEERAHQRQREPQPLPELEALERPGEQDLGEHLSQGWAVDLVHAVDEIGRAHV